MSALIMKDMSGPQIRVTENYFSYFSTKTYVVDTQKNSLNETVLLSTQNTCWIKLMDKKIITIVRNFSFFD